jgi:hypothetical protein
MAKVDSKVREFAISEQELLRVYRQLTKGEGIRHPVAPRRACAIIRSNLLVWEQTLTVPNASNFMLDMYEKKVEALPSNKTNGGKKNIPRLQGEDRDEGNIGVNKYGSTYEPRSEF